MSALPELAAPVAEVVWMAEIDAASLALVGEGGPNPSVAVTTLRWASRAFTTDPVLDTPAATPVEGRLSSGFTISRSLAADADTGFGSMADLSVGELAVENTDRALDALPGLYAVTGRECRVYAARWADVAAGILTAAGDAFPWDDGAGNPVAWDDGSGGQVLWEQGGAAGTGALARFVRVFRGRVASWSYSGGRVIVRLEPDARKLDSPLQSATFDGTGDLGGDPGLAGVTKPVVLGRCRGIEPKLIDAALLVYMVNDGAIYSIPGVRDIGLDLTFVKDFGSYAELKAATVQGLDDAGGPFDIPGGSYATCLAEGVFRVGWPPQGRLIADVNGSGVEADIVQPWGDGTYWADGAGWRTHSLASYASGARHIVQRVLTAWAGFTADEVDSEGIDHLNGRDPDGSLDPSAGFYLPAGGNTTCRDVLRQLCRAAGVVAFQGRDGSWKVRYLEVPDLSAAVLTLDRSMLVPDSMERLDLNWPQPWSTWKAAYDRNWTPLTASDLAGGADATDIVDPDIRAFSLRAAAYAEAKDAALDLLWPQGRTATLETNLSDKADADVRVAQMAALYDRHHGLYQAKWEGIFGALEFLDAVTVVLPQLGCDAGRTFLAVRLTEDGATRQVETVLFG